MSQDGTTQKKIPHETRFVYVRDPRTNKLSLFMLPFTREESKSSDTQLHGWRNMLETLCANWNRGMGKTDEIDADELWVKVLISLCHPLDTVTHYCIGEGDDE